HRSSQRDLAISHRHGHFARIKIIRTPQPLADVLLDALIGALVSLRAPTTSQQCPAWRPLALPAASAVQPLTTVLRLVVLLSPIRLLRRSATPIRILAQAPATGWATSCFPASAEVAPNAFPTCAVTPAD